MAKPEKQMSNRRKNSHSGLPEKEGSKDTSLTLLSGDINTPPQIPLLSRLLKTIANFATGVLGKLTCLVSRLSKSMKKNTSIAALVVVVVLAGHAASAQVAPSLPLPLASLKTVPIPQPDNIGDFIRNKTAAIALGKSLFWDMQVGSDGVQSCASCHFNAGADSRSKNQLNPGLLRVNTDGSENPDKTFSSPHGPNYQLAAADYPFHKLVNPDKISSTVVSDSNDVTSSQGVFKSEFVDVVPGSAQDSVTPEPDDVFNVGGKNVRQVAPRNSPTTINAVFNFRNFWDGRAQNIFNGVNPFGLRDPNAFVLKADSPRSLKQVQVKLNNSSLASQAVGPPTSKVEESGGGRNLRQLLVAPGARVVPNQQLIEGSSVGPQFETLNPLFNQNGPLKLTPKKIGKKMLSLTPLGKQIVHPDDSVLGAFSRVPQPGLTQSYETMIQVAFNPDWWRSNLVVSFDENGNGTVIQRPNRPLTTNEVTLMEYNFSLFFGLAIQAYESTLVANNTPFDQYKEGKTTALTSVQKTGLDIFQNKGKCIGCHGGPELTIASVENVVSHQGRIRRLPVPGNPVQDTGFFNIGVRPKTDDFGVGGNDQFGNPLSESRLAQQGKFQQLLGNDPPGNPPTLSPQLDANETVVADGAFKAPGLRNVELTAPYFHNGGQLNLEQVVDFYNRGGDFGGLPVLGLSNDEKKALVAFLKSLTDERVRYQQAPFDHPQLFVPNGHPGDQNSVTNDGTGKATDALLEIPAVGRKGGNPLANFLG